MTGSAERCRRAAEHLGFALAIEGRTVEAIQQFETAIRLDPADARSRTGLGEALDAAGKLEAATLEYEKAVRLNPALPEARADLGNSLARLGRMDEAETQLREAVRLRPDDSASRYDLAVRTVEDGAGRSRAAATRDRRPSEPRVRTRTPDAGRPYAASGRLAVTRIPTMIAGKKVVVVMPAYNAERTLERTWREVVAFDFVDLVIVVDDASQDGTLALAAAARRSWRDCTRATAATARTRRRVIGCARPRRRHRRDDPPGLPVHAETDAGDGRSGRRAACTRASSDSRILGGQALEGGMPLWRYVANRGLTLVGTSCSGPRSRSSTRAIEPTRASSSSSCRSTRTRTISCSTTKCSPKPRGSATGFGEVSCPTRYAPDASSIDFVHCVIYGLGCLKTASTFRLSRVGHPFARPRFPRERWMLHNSAAAVSDNRGNLP